MKLNADNPGLAAEKLAETFLTEKGLKLIARNYHCKYGEIDLIMQDVNTVVFVEVRLRTNAKFGSAAMSITSHKQHKLIAAAQHYLINKSNLPCRFDAILMHKTDLASIEWVRNAFDA